MKQNRKEEEKKDKKEKVNKEKGNGMEKQEQEIKGRSENWCDSTGERK